MRNSRGGGFSKQYFDDLLMLPGVRAQQVSFERFLRENKHWFNRLSTYWAARLPPCHITREDLEQEAKTWAWMYIFGASSENICVEAYRLNCCGRTWPNPLIYLRHRKQRHPGAEDTLFSRYVAFNVGRRLKHTVRAAYAKKRDVRATVLLPGDDSDWMSMKDEAGDREEKKSTLSSKDRKVIMESDVVQDESDFLFEVMVRNATEQLDNRAKFLLQRMLDGEPIFESKLTKPSIGRIKRGFSFLHS